MNRSTARKSTERWLPAESVMVVPHTLMNAQGVKGNRPVDYGAWQVFGHVARAASGELFVLTVLIEPPHVVILRSSDGGRTWSEPQVIWRNDQAQKLNAIARGLRVLPSGRIIGFFLLEYAPDRPGEMRNYLWSVHSDDGGRTWHKSPGPLDVSPFWSVSVPTNAFEDEDGHLILPVEGVLEPPKKGDPLGWWGVPYALGYLRSHDGGLTWRDRWLAVRATPNDAWEPAEHLTVPLRNGKWILFADLYCCRPKMETVTLHRGVSLDRGRTWSPLQHNGFTSNNHGVIHLPDGGIMIHGRSSNGLKYRVSYDEGCSWAYEHQLEPGGDAALSSVALDERTLFVLHSSPGPPHSGGYYISGLRGQFLRKG